MKMLSRLLPALTLTLAAAAPAVQAAETFRDLQIEVVGSGRPVVMVPGLNSAAAVWTETCAALQPQVQCHIVQLPGFAGAPAAAGQASYLEGMRDRLIAYVDARKLERPVLLGHSLGGALALMMASEAPAKFDRVVVVDSLPFLAALRNPAATAEQARAMGAGMRTQMLAGPPLPDAQARAMAASMTRSPDGIETIVAWGKASDRATTAQAMSELWGGDLRPLLPRIATPVLVLGSWAAHQPMGATLDSTRQIFATQYAGLKGAQIRMSERGYHFLMWDDPSWLVGEVRGFLAAQ